jgi:hypothetical protein
MRTWLPVGLAALTITLPPQVDPLREVQASTNITWLERIAGTAGAAEERKTLYGPKNVRAAAYLRLAEIGSVDALAAARRVEAAAREWTLVPDTVSLRLLPHPAGHFSDAAHRPFAQVTAPDRTTYALIALQKLAGADAFLMTSRTPDDPDSWSRPRLLPLRATHGIVEPELTFVGKDLLRLTFGALQDSRGSAPLRPWPLPPNPPAGRQTWDIVPSELTRDTDGDGWSDVEERRLGLNPGHYDSDGDGIGDGLDVCPSHAPSPLEVTDPEAAILRKVFFAAYGVFQSHDMYMVAGGARPVQLWGSRAPVLYGIDREDWFRRWGAAPPRLFWRLKAISRDQDGVQVATVDFGDFEAALAAATYTATLKLLDGEWFVVKIVMTGIS